MALYTFRLSVRALASYVCQSGRLMSRGDSPYLLQFSRMQEGMRVHALLQHRPMQNYEREVYITLPYREENILLKVQGRIDGLYLEDGLWVVEEIKSLLEVPDSFEGFAPSAIAQAKLYAAMLCQNRKLQKVSVRLIGVWAGSDVYNTFTQVFEAPELLAYFKETCQKYLQLAKLLCFRQAERDLSLQTLHFPYGEQRAGQQEFMDLVEKSVEETENALVQAPTGIGKTICTLYGALLGFKKQLLGRIFYLTARTPVRFVAEKTLQDMLDGGLKIFTVSLSAKDKMCLRETRNCDDCPFAEHYYDVLPGAREALLKPYLLRSEDFIAAGKEFNICPFELSLELARYADVILGDYNYVFHPDIALNTLLSDKRRTPILLVDEAHNLLDRAREFFSAKLEAAAMGEVLALLPQGMARDSLNALLKWLLHQGKKLKEDNQKAALWEEIPMQGLTLLSQAMVDLEAHCIALPHPVIEDYCFTLQNFLRAHENVDRTWQICMQAEGPLLWLYCVNPAPQLQKVLDKACSSIFFSATLTPLWFYRQMLCEEEPSTLSLPSPFPEENLCVMVHKTIKTTYAKRSTHYEEVARTLLAAMTGKTGNYMAFFPSYAYLQEVHRYLTLLAPTLALQVQTSGMKKPSARLF